MPPVYKCISKNSFPSMVSHATSTLCARVAELMRASASYPMFKNFERNSWDLILGVPTYHDMFNL